MNIYRLFRIPVSEIPKYLDNENNISVRLPRPGKVRKKLNQEGIYLIETSSLWRSATQLNPIIKFCSEFGYVLTLYLTQNSKQVYSVNYCLLKEEGEDLKLSSKWFMYVENTLTPDMTIEEILRRARE